jgi:hypothetical protein
MQNAKKKKKKHNNRNDTKTDIRLRDVKVGEALLSVCVRVCVCHMQTCRE